MTARALLNHLKSAQLGEDEPEAGGVGHAENALDEPRRAVVVAHGEAGDENEAGGGGGKADDAAAPPGTAPVTGEDGEPASPTTKTKSVLGPVLLVKGAERKEVGGGNGRAADAEVAAGTAGAPADADKDGEPAPPMNKAKSVLSAALLKGSAPAGVLKKKTSLQMKQVAAISKLTAVSKMQMSFSSKKTQSVRGSSVLEDLMAACASRDHSQVHAEFCVRMLTANYSLAKTIGPEGHLPLHALCMAQSHTSYSVVICQALLKANPDAVGVRWKAPGVDFASLPLHLICRQHHLTAYSAEICRLLLAGKEDTCLIPSGGQLPISIALEEHSVVSNHHVTIFRRLLEANRDCVKQKDINGATLVHRLCVSSRKRQHSENITECLRLIFEFNKRIVDADDKSSCKPLHALCKSSFPTEQTVAICEMLLHAAPDAIMQRDDTGKLPLHYLCSNHGLTEVSAQLCRMLLELYVKSASAHDGAGETALHHLCSSPTLNRFSVDCARQLMLSHKTCYEMADKRGMRPLHTLCASMAEHRKGMEFAEEIYDMLLSGDPSVLEAQDHNGRLPLHLLCEAGFFSSHSIHILEKMLKAVPSTLLARDTDGRLPLHLLCVSKLHTQLTYDAYKRLVQELTGDHGEHSNPASFQMMDGSLPLHNLCGAGSHSEYSLQMFRALVQAFPSSISAFDSGGQNALHRLCGASGHTTHTDLIFNELLAALSKIGKSGAELTTMQGILPLHIICGAGSHTHTTYRIFTELLVLFKGSSLVASTKEKELAIHVLCRAPNHTEISGKMCHDLLAADDESVRRENARGLKPLEVLCECESFTSHSVAISSLIVKHLQVNSIATQWLSALKVLCSNTNISEHSVQICEVIIANLKRGSAAVDISPEFLPLHYVCESKLHNEWTGKICNMLLALCPEWARTKNSEGFLPLHLLCNAPCLQEHSVEMCASLLRSYPESCNAQGGPEDMRPLHILAHTGLHTLSSIQICKQLLAGDGRTAASEKTKDGSLPLHVLCRSSMLTDCSIEICNILLDAYIEAARLSAGGDDKDLALHKLCLTTPHSAQSIKMCRLLVHAYPDAINVPGNHHDPEVLKGYEVKGIDPSKEPGDEPLAILCRADLMTRYTADLCMMVSGAINFNIHPALSILNEKVYRPRGNETQQKMALRALISLAMVASEEASSYIELDSEAHNGPRQVSFLRGVEREMGEESNNQLLHVLRMAELYKIEAAKTGSGSLVMKLNSLSQQCLEWAIAMVDKLPAKVAKKAIWTPEKDSCAFMKGSTPIGIAVDLGDLKIVSSSAVFDVVRRAWPGKYQWEYNPMHGTIFSNLILEFEMEEGSSTRNVVWTFSKRLLELLNPSILIASPMNMYFLGIMMQVALLVAFQITLDVSHSPREYDYSFGPPEWYLIVHIVGGIVFESGQLHENGTVGYLADPWNYIDIGMYSLLVIWGYMRADEWYQKVYVEGGSFTPDRSTSSIYIGMAGICIWIRILNVFGLDPYFGPLVRIMQGMTKGVITFLILLAIFVMGFATALRSIFRTVDRDHPTVTEMGFDAILDLYEDPGYSMVSLLNMALGQFDLALIYQINKEALAVIFAFLACTFVMLFNLLIALMTDTYSEIRLESEQLWKKDRAMLMATYTTTDPMLESFNYSTIMTCLPPPLNLVVLSCVIICMPFYLLAQVRVKSKTWERKANDLRLAITRAFLFFLVCLPSAIFFMFVSLPLNWALVGSAGTLDYLRMPLYQREPHKRIMVSRMFSFVATPFFLVYFPVFFVVRFIGRCVSRAKPEDDAHEDEYHESHGVQVEDDVDAPVVHGQMFGSAAGETGAHTHSDSDVILHRAKGDENDGHGDHHQPWQKKLIEIWEEEMEEDDFLILHETYVKSKPLDSEDLAAASALAEMNKDQAMTELKQDLAKTFQKLDSRQKAVIDCLNDLDLGIKKVQQESTRNLADLKALVHKEVHQVETNARINQKALLELIDKQSQLTETRLQQQDEKVNLLLAAVCGPVAGIQEGEAIPAAKEGGLLLTAITRRLEALERKEEAELKLLQELLTKTSSSTGEQIDNVNHRIMAKVNAIEAVIPNVFGDLATRLAEVEKKNEDSLGTLRSAVIEDIRPLLKNLDERVKQGEAQMQDNIGVMAGISPALAGIEARLNASAISLQSETKAEISRALEVKMMELLGEIELQFRPSPVPSPVAAHEPSFDHRVDSAINTLQGKNADAPRSWEREWDDINRLSSRQDPTTKAPSAKGANGHGTAHASPGNGTRNGSATRSGSAKMRESAKEEESLDERIESVLSTLEGKVASPSPQWQLEWERRQANKTKSPASSRR